MTTHIGDNDPTAEVVPLTVDDLFGDDVDLMAESDDEVDDFGADGNADLREAVKRSKREEIFLKMQLVESSVRRLGLDPLAGLGRAVCKQWPYRSELDSGVENVELWMQAEYGWSGNRET